MQSQAGFGTLIVPPHIQVTQGMGTEFEEDSAHLQQLNSSTLATLMQWGPQLLLHNGGLSEIPEALRLDTQNLQLRAATGWAVGAAGCSRHEAAKPLWICCLSPLTRPWSGSGSVNHPGPPQRCHVRSSWDNGVPTSAFCTPHILQQACPN